jgi:hypothetical protein
VGDGNFDYVKMAILISAVATTGGCVIQPDPKLRSGCFTASAPVSQSKIKSEIVECEERIPLQHAILLSVFTARCNDGTCA